MLGEAKKLCPDAAVVIMTAYATVETAVAAMKMGAYDYLVKPFDPEELSLLMQKIVTQQTLVREKYLLRKALKREYRFCDFVSKNPAVQSVFELARAAAAQQFHHPHPGRERHRQGAAGPCHPCRESARAPARSLPSPAPH